MFTLNGFEIKSKIYESSNSLVYRAIRESDNQPIILKVLKEDYPTPQELARYRTEYEITKSLNISGVIKVYDLQKYQNTLVMFLEDFGGESLKIWMQQRSFSLAEFLSIAIKTTQILGDIHQANIIHKDINPANIVFNPKTGDLKIIDFGISTQLNRENTTIKNPNILEGTLTYISPEQTGRMNRILDYRTDFYSLGVTFYEILTGELPFTTTDTLELVHFHIAKTPILPSEIKPDIPLIISKIILKLMSKTAEERYQSAVGIKADLELCLNQLENQGMISEFPLGINDLSGKFQLPQKLYGRKQEIETLLSAFDRTTTQQSELILVAGYSGVGKTALVQEIYKPITEKRGYFIKGKFDQFQRNIPYSAVVNAFKELIKQLLSEPEKILKQWRETILKAVGVNGQIIIDVLPEVELIIGKQSPIPELGPNESQNRFNFVLQSFIQVFTKSEHPLALFLDDLQWADGASLQLMQLLMKSVTKGLFLIGAYRDNEVFAAHPLMLTLEEIAKKGGNINQIILAPLTLTTVTELISDTVKSSSEQVTYLAELITLKTGGNPFFVNEFLRSLYTEKLLYFNGQQKQWQWNIEEIKARGFTDNVVELMTEKLQKLPEHTQELLKLSACIGNIFELKTLMLVSGKSLGEIVKELFSAEAENLIFSVSNKEDIELAIASTESFNLPLIHNYNLEIEYKFVHDRIQQASYSLIPDNETAIIHQQIGQILLKNTHPEQQEEKIFDIVNQLNVGIQLIKEQSEKDQLAKLNLIAGKKAKVSNAYQPALNYLQTGLDLLTDNSWNNNYELTLSLYNESAEVAYLIGDFIRMEKFIEVIRINSKNLLDQIKIYELKILTYNVQGNLQEGIKLSLKFLELLGVKLCLKPSPFQITWQLLKTQRNIANKQIANLINLPVMSDPYHLAILSIMSKLVPTAYSAQPTLFLMIVLEMVNLSITWGNCEESAFAYSNYGIILCGVLGDIEKGFQFGQVALNLLSKLKAIKVKTKTEFSVNNFIRPWKESLHKNLKLSLKNYQLGLETGDLEFAAYSLEMYVEYAFLSGVELQQLKSEIISYTELLRQMGQERMMHGQNIYHQAILNLSSTTENNFFAFSGSIYNEEVMLPILREQGDQYGLFNIYFNRLIFSYLFGNVEEAIVTSQEIKKYKYFDPIKYSVLIVYFYFYDSLSHLASLDNLKYYTQYFGLKKITHNQKKMKKWAKFAPINHLHKYYLVEAEICRVLGKNQSAIDYYDKAISLAKENEFVHEAALAYELGAKFYLSQGRELTARAYMQEAQYHYQLWGAVAKVKDLEKRYPQLLANQQKTKENKTVATITTTDSGSNLDIATIMKATQAISGEIMLDNLLASLMTILIENAGAQRGYLILANQSELLIETEGTIESQQVTLWKSTPINNCQNLSQAIVNYVARTQESVVLNDATKTGQFTNDIYIKENQPKSVLCVPLINQGQLISIVYLENNLTTEAFTPERINILQLLSGQAAISLQNAKLYAEVRDNEKRLIELNQAYERFVPRQFLQFLEKSSIVDVKLGDQIQLEMSVLFSDIRSFTTLSESMTPEDNFKFINAYLSRMESAIIENHGFIDKYIGDAIMALFSGEADNAIKAGISMLERLKIYNQDRINSGYQPIQNGIGINTGSLMLGTVGGQNRMDGTVISDAVNLASRVESLTKDYGVSLLITEPTYSRLTNPANYAIRMIDTVKVKGKSQAVTVYEVFDADAPEIKEGKLATRQTFMEALSLYHQKKLLQAAELFRECLGINPGDRVSKIYYDRCQRN